MTVPVAAVTIAAVNTCPVEHQRVTVDAFLYVSHVVRGAKLAVGQLVAGQPAAQFVFGQPGDLGLQRVARFQGVDHVEHALRDG